MRVLIIYPNMPFQFSLPHSVAQLSACLKKKGHIVKLFDTTMYKSDVKTDEDRRMERGQIKPYTTKGIKTTDKYEDFNKCIDEFKPDKLMITFVDNTYDIGMKLLKSAKKRIYTIAGGVSVILNPERYKNDLIDKVWTDTAQRLFFPDNSDIELMDDWTIFDEDRLYRPFSGKYYKIIPILTDNGCPYSCGFCCAPALRKNIDYKKKSLDSIVRELKYQIKKHNPTFIYFSSETFFSMKKFPEFAEIYKKYKIPFWCQTHVSTITESRVKLLKDMGVHRVAIGIESGDERYRRDMVRKYFTNNRAIKAFRILQSHGINASANNIIGLPLETKDNIKETIKLNKRLHREMPDMQLNCYIYQPYYGTELRHFCDERKLLRKEPNTVHGDPSIDNPYVSDSDLIYVRDNFNKIITGEKKFI